MNDIFRQLGVLFLGSIPTMVLFLILVFCYAALVERPLRRVLGERRERTAGAVERAHASIAVAEAKAAEYESRLRAARVEMQQARERQIAGWNAERDGAIADARAAAGARVRSARAALEADGERTRAGMSESIDGLAEQILGRVLSPASSRPASRQPASPGSAGSGSAAPGSGIYGEVRF